MGIGGCIWRVWGSEGMVDWWDEKGIWWRVGSGYFLDAKQEVGWHEREDALSRF